MKGGELFARRSGAALGLDLGLELLGLELLGLALLELGMGMGLELALGLVVGLEGRWRTRASDAAPRQKD